MAILVTGGTGFIGSHTVVELLQANEKVIIVDNLKNSKKCVLDRIEAITGKRPVFYRVDLLDKEALDSVFKENPDMTAVIHFAGLKAVGESVEKPLLYYHDNLTTTFHLLECMEKHGVDRMLFGTDSPWHSAEMERALLCSLSLTEEELAKIYSGNARRLLRL